MLADHRLGRDYVQGIREGLAGHRNGDPKATNQLIENAKQFIRHLSQHIDKEDQILFQMADRHLSQEKQDELARDFDRLEKEKISIGRHEAFHEMLNHLQDVYL